MSEPVHEQLYHLLPAVYRTRDAENGQVLLLNGAGLREKFWVSGMPA